MLTRMMLRLALLALLGAVAFGPARSAFAQAEYGSPELIAAAKKEGRLTFYASNFLEFEQEMVKAFNKRFPDIRVETIRAPGGQIVTRTRTEAAAGKLLADAIEISDRGLAKDLLEVFADYAPPNADLYPPETRTLDRLWPRGGNAWTITWNTALLPKAPTGWKDLIDPENAKYHIGVVVALSGGAPWMKAMFERKTFGIEFWEKQAALKPTLYASQAPLIDGLIRGEVAIAALVTNLSIPMKRQGAPVDWVFASEGVPATFFAAGVPKTAPNPNAGRLYLNWSLSREGQEAAVYQGNFSAMRGGPLPEGVTKVQRWDPDPQEYETLRDPWIQEWNRVYNYR